MNRSYLVLIVVAVGLAIGMLLMDKKVQIRETDPATLAIAYNIPSRFLSIDEVTDRLIKKDPSLLLIDIRPSDQFKAFAIPGAMNIPLDSLLSNSSLGLLKAKEYDKVLYSNSDVWSDEAWILCERMEMPNIFVMKGGINYWFQSFAQPTEPLASAPKQELDLYAFRMAASQFFYGGAEIPKPVVTVKKPVKVIRQQPEPSTGGGC